jgi:hypothetical protein
VSAAPPAAWPRSMTTSASTCAALAEIEAPARGCARLREARREHRGLRRGRDELEVRSAAGEAQRATRQEATAKPGHPAMLRASRPVELAAGHRAVAAREPHGQPGERRVSPPARWLQAGTLRLAVAVPRRVDARQLRPQREHEVPLRP